MSKKETTRVRRTFTPQFKQDAVWLVHRGKSVTEVARGLGIARSLLQRWREQIERDSNPVTSSSSGSGDDKQRIKELEKRLRDASEERDILKKALAYFADDQK